MIIQIRRFAYAAAKDLMDEWFRYDVPGIAPLAYLGYPDGLEVDAERYRELNVQHDAPPAMVAEVLPDGAPLAEVEALTNAELVRFGLGLCDTLRAWGQQCSYASEGFTPETVFIAGERGTRYFSGAIPRVYVIDGGEPHEKSFDWAHYGGPMSGPFEMTFQDATFMVAQVIWFAATREHAYRLQGRAGDVFNMAEDRRRPFTGNSEIGALLERALVFDEAKRIDVHALRAGLVALAQRWGVELPPFPPPGLAD